MAGTLTRKCCYQEYDDEEEEEERRQRDLEWKEGCKEKEIRPENKVEENRSAHTQLFWCSVCESVICNACWGQPPPHRPNNRTVTKKHEKTSLELAELINAILCPDTNLYAHNELHHRNLETKWFGVIEDSTTRGPRFHDSGRFTHLVNGSERHPSEQYPCLATFVGETGAGKSTLISALIKV